MTDPSLSKETLGLAAEFAVASELCRRGIYAQLTLGNRKRTDLLVDSEDGQMLHVQVKAKQKREWPALKGISDPSFVLVLVDYEKKQLFERPDFYVLTSADWAKVATLARNTLIKTGKVASADISLDENFVATTRAKRARGKPEPKDYVGIGVKQEQVTKYKECWEKITGLLGIPT